MAEEFLFLSVRTEYLLFPLSNILQGRAGIGQRVVRKGNGKLTLYLVGISC